jgi:hypothetical protein
MAFTTPKTWTTGEVLTSADMNTFVRDNSADLNDSRIVRIYAESLSGVGTTGTIAVPSGFRDLLVSVSRRHSGTGFVAVNLRINGQTSGYASGAGYISESGASAATALTTGALRLGWLGGSGAGNGGSINAVVNHADAAVRPMASSFGFAREGTSYRAFNAGGILESAGAVTSLTVYLESNNFDSARIRVWGRR